MKRNITDIELVSIDDYLRTFKDQNNYKAQKSAQFLEEKGVLPLTYGNKHLEPLNILAAWTFWGGSIGDDFTAGIYPEPRYTDSITAEADKLDLDFLVNGYVKFAKNGHSIARLIHLLDVPKSDADKESGELPEYVENLVAWYGSHRNESKKIAQKVIADHIRVLLQSKHSQGPDGNYIRLPVKSTPEAATQLYENVIRMFSRVFPQIDLQPDGKEPYINNGKFEKRILFGPERMFEAFRYGLFDMTPSTSYQSATRIRPR